MHRIRPIMLFALPAAMLALACSARAGAAEPMAPPEYDAALAAELGADDYGMRQYVLVILRTGPAKIDDAERRRALFAGHFAAMSRLAEKGELVMAGPISDKDGDKRGLFILNAQSIDAAREMVAQDPTIAEGVFVADYAGFYGSAALLRLNALHKQVQKVVIE